MFGRKNQSDLKKSVGKVLDCKKDNITRLKHLKVLLGEYVIFIYLQSCQVSRCHRISLRF